MTPVPSYSLPSGRTALKDADTTNTATAAGVCVSAAAPADTESARMHASTPAKCAAGTGTTTATATAMTTREKEESNVPNGGYGWICTLCVALINAHTWGLNSSYGVFLAHYLANNTYPGATSLHFAFIGSLSISCSMLVSPLATVCVRKYGTHVTLYIGVVLEAASLVGASFAREIWQLFLTQGVLFGIAMGFLFVPSAGIIPQWFTTKRSLANGFSSAGSGIGGLVWSLVSGVAMRRLGVPWTYRILGIVSLVVNAVCAALVRDRNAAVGSTQNAFDRRILRRFEYLVMVAFGWFSILGYVVLIFSLANYANSIGLSASDAALVSAMLNLGQGIGRPLIGYFSDVSGRINMAFCMTLLCAVLVFAVWVPAQSLGLLVFFAICGGAVAGTFWASIVPVTAEVVGLADVPSALNLMWLVIVLPATFSETIAMEIVAATGKYIGAQVFVGCMYVAAAASLVVLRGWKIRQNIREAAAAMVEVSDTDAKYSDKERCEVIPVPKTGSILHHALAFVKV